MPDECYTPTPDTDETITGVVYRVHSVQTPSDMLRELRQGYWMLGKNIALFEGWLRTMTVVMDGRLRSMSDL